MVRNSMWERCIRSASATAVFLFLVFGFIMPAITSEQASPPDEVELNRMLKDACGKCHNLNRVILQTGEWKLKDWMHAFDKMAKPSGLTRTAKKATVDYTNNHRQEIELERGDKQDKPDTMSIDTYYVLFENRCVVCHDAEMIDRIPEDLDRKDLQHIVDRMVEKAPHFLDGVNKENVVEYLDKPKSDTEEVANHPQK